MKNTRVRQMFLAGLLLVSGYAFAIDGILSIGDKSRRASAFSNIKSDLKISLGSGLYHYRSMRALPGAPHTTVTAGPRSMVIYQRGNVSIHIPVNTKPSLLRTFKTPTAPTLR
ncbi:MAG: hypothetical protein EBZ67_04125 [Chitinophagia bacterium]|nr:hypothetical protein [Chitinophagia bacterium]